eukprot:353893-Chlamydomonas_euryale.AAC.14
MQPRCQLARQSLLTYNARCHALPLERSLGVGCTAAARGGHRRAGGVRKGHAVKAHCRDLQPGTPGEHACRRLSALNACMHACMHTFRGT